MKSSELTKLGVPPGEAMRLAMMAAEEAEGRGVSKKNVRKQIRGALASPQAHVDHAYLGKLAAYLLGQQIDEPALAQMRDEPAPFQVWGDDIDAQSLAQMQNACMLPVAVRGAMMPDAHVGYGLPIGGVLATRNAVIPYAVGVDIACRMKLTVLDLPVNTLTAQGERLAKALREETSFGRQTFKLRRHHAVMDEDWAVTPVTQPLKDRAWAQLGTSGGGNHFVEFGEFRVTHGQLGVEPGHYLALLSHSGSRGPGAAVAEHYSKLAMTLHPELPKELRYLAWLDLESAEGQAYWAAMQLMGRYAAANHACIHQAVAKAVGGRPLLSIENHHNFAWREEHINERGAIEPLIVHRKGATPAGAGVLGIIPGSMASPAYIVRGKGVEAALDSASHGAGRRFSRSEAKESFTWSDTNRLLAERGVTLLSAGLDEAPQAYKDIDAVMAAQRALVEMVAHFDPKLVRMAGG
ncbi:MAG: RtcB family protein [Caldilineaceae bacterium]